MSNDLSVRGPVTIQDNSKERVALELTYLIAGKENNHPDNRKYWLTLYSKCLSATSGYGFEED